MDAPVKISLPYPLKKRGTKNIWVYEMKLDYEIGYKCIYENNSYFIRKNCYSLILVINSNNKLISIYPE